VFNRTDYQLESGKLQAYAWPGGYPLFYCAYDENNDTSILCPDCANSETGNTDSLLRIFAADVNWEDVSRYCDHCEKSIPSAYGEDDNAND
jgi:hypothetical protein